MSGEIVEEGGNPFWPHEKKEDQLAAPPTLIASRAGHDDDGHILSTSTLGTWYHVLAGQRVLWRSAATTVRALAVRNGALELIS